MSLPAWIGVVLAATCGCDVVFGLADRNPPPADAAEVDGPPHVVGVATLVDPPMIGDPVVIGEVWPVTTVVHGTAGEYVPFTFTATAGAFAALPAEVLIGAGGTTEVVGDFTAPSTRQQVTLTATSTPRSALKTLPVLGLDAFGPTITGPGAATYLGDTLFGIRLSFPSGGQLRQLGLISKSSCMAKLALYIEGNPSTKIAEIGPVQLSGSDAAPVINTFDVALADRARFGTTGSAWLVVVADASLTLPQQAGAGTLYTYISSFGFSTPFPPGLSISALSGQEYALFAVIAN